MEIIIAVVTQEGEREWRGGERDLMEDMEQIESLEANTSELSPGSDTLLL